jgi:zinc/manganese transport system permease protein
MGAALRAIFEPGLLQSGVVQIAAVLGGVAAVVSGVVGVFIVVRGQSFAGHALADVGTAGGSGAFLVGVAPIWGFIAVAIGAAGAMELAGVQRPKQRDFATGLVLGAALGFAALLLYLDTTYTNTSGAANTILFGDIFANTTATIPVATAAGALALGVVALLYRPLLLSSVSPALAAVRGVPVRLVGALYLGAVAVAVALSAVTIGAILSTALLIGPAATALRLTRRPGRAMALAAAIGVGATWLGIVLAYDSYDWTSAGHTWPVSFFVVTIVFALYMLASLVGRRSTRRAR